MLPTHCRAQAATIRRLAEAVEDPREREQFLDVAAEYERLADCTHDGRFEEFRRNHLRRGPISA